MPNIDFTSAQINRRLSLIAENKNLLQYPYKNTLPDGLTDVGDGSILTSGAYSKQQNALITTHDLPAGSYIASLAITDIKENPSMMSGFVLKVTANGTTYTTTSQSNDAKKTFVDFNLPENSTVSVTLDIPNNVIIGLLIKPQIEKNTDDGQPSDWVPNMDQIGTYVDRRFNGTNAKIKVLDEKIETFNETIENVENNINDTITQELDALKQEIDGDISGAISTLNQEVDTVQADLGTLGNKFKISGTVTKAIGGITKDTTYTEAELSTVLSDLLFPYVAPTMSSITLSAAAGTFEYGTTKTVSKVTPNFTKGSKNITSVKIGTTSGGADLYSGSSATSGTAITLTTSKTYDGTNGGTIYCTISDGTQSADAEASVRYTYYDYSKLTTSTTPSTSGATKQTNSGADNTYTYSNGQYLWLYSRSSGKKIQQYISGTWADVDTYGGSSLTLTLSNETTATYYAYRTDKFTANGSARYRLA